MSRCFNLSQDPGDRLDIFSEQAQNSGVVEIAALLAASGRETGLPISMVEGHGGSIHLARLQMMVRPLTFLRMLPGIHSTHPGRVEKVRLLSPHAFKSFQRRPDKRLQSCL